MKALIAVAAMQALCPGVHFFQGSDVLAYQHSISWNKAELTQAPLDVQRFIIKHECGHIKGYRTETGADTYAFKFIHPPKEVTDEICRELTEYHDANAASRCANLKRLQNGSGHRG